MVNIRKQGREEPSILKSALIGAAVSIVLMIVSNASIAWLTVSERMPQEMLGHGVLLILMLSAGAGALTSIKIAKCKQLLVSVLSGTIYCACLLIVTVFCFGGEFDGVVVTISVILAGAICVALLSAGIGQKAQKGNKKRHHR